MLCQSCRKRPATVKVTTIINNQKRETHLCEACAREHQGADLGIGPEFSLQSLLTGLLKHEMAPWAPSTTSRPTEELKCKECGLTYQEFAHTGLLGCKECYHQFKEKLEPLVRRIHGANQHQGKLPKRAGKSLRAQRELTSLRQEMQRLVQQEQFEEAAELRDRIKQLEQNLGSAADRGEQ